MPDLLTAAALSQVARRCNAGLWAPLLESAGQGRAINNPLRIAHWLTQFHVETSGFTVMVESLNYTARRITQVWPHRFSNLVAAQPYAFEPRKLADAVYGGRMGNVKPDDGWDYRGRGPGLTGRENYRSIGQMIGEPLEEQPDLAATPQIAALVGAAFWQRENLSPLADDDDLVGVTEKWNGGLTDLAARRSTLAAYKHALGLTVGA